MAEEDIIVIDDDMDDEVVIINDIEEIIIEDDDDNNNAMDIADEDGADEDESEEDVQSLADSDYASDNDDELKQKKCRQLNAAEINNIDITMRMCCIKYYYYDAEEGTKYCSECFLRLASSFRNVYSVRKHKTDHCVLLMGSCCKECKRSLYQVIPCNMCPICTS